MMTVDRDLKIIRTNESTRKLLREHAVAFRTMWPSFNPDAIIGTCIDVFHKAPSHQRQILADPNRLPYKADITVGDLKFARNVSAVFDNQRNYVGNVLQWDDVTTARLNSGTLAAFNRAQAIIAFTDRQGHRRDGQAHGVSRAPDRAGPWQHGCTGEIARRPASVI